MAAKKKIVVTKVDRAAGEVTTDAAPAVVAEVDAVIRLIDHCKKQGIAFFEGLGGVKFGFRRESVRPPAPAVNHPSDEGDDWIP